MTAPTPRRSADRYSSRSCAILKRLVSAMAFAGLVTGAQAQAAGDPLPRATPAEMGFSPERFARIGQAIERDVADGKLPGVVIAIARNGKLVALDAYGFRDKAAGVPMTTDTIFSIASMTKPMTTVAALTLAEQGRLVIDEPVSGYLAGRFKESKVAVIDEGGAMLRTVPPTRPITVRDLLTHTSGLVYGGRGTTAVHALYPRGSAAAAKDLTGEAFLDKVGAAPLLNQPGAVWDYGFGLDVTGLLVEALTRRSLGTYLSETVFTPLGMADTGFQVPPEKVARYARALANDPETGKPQPFEPDSTMPAQFECGGGCAVSTASDYLRFATMLLNGGEFAGHRVLSPAMTRAMLTNQLGPQVQNRIGAADPTRADYGFGLGLAVRTTPGVVRLLGSVGDFSWPGATGTNWWVDPERNLVVVFMAHSPAARWHYRYLINTLVYQAIER